MENSIINSTLLLNVLLAIGLFFFIKASVKPRIEKMELFANQSEDGLLEELQNYFASKAYQLKEVNQQKQQIVFEGLVQASRFLAFFLSLLAAIGLICLALVMNVVAPDLKFLWFGLPLISPIAGWFYWRKATRLEQVILAIEAVDDNALKINFTGHRDELKAIKEFFAHSLNQNPI
ncbi:MAG: cofactor assembly of complex C subunit B [Synechococcaceae cyanobacterium RL_1_2]|nr:cofactor assembly of complex C subunit B [Synechococcaceae cyanobacterium RL_1_2]